MQRAGREEPHLGPGFKDMVLKSHMLMRIDRSCSKKADTRKGIPKIITLPCKTCV